MDLFKFYVEDLKGRLHEEKKIVKEILKVSKHHLYWCTWLHCIGAHNCVVLGHMFVLYWGTCLCCIGAHVCVVLGHMFVLYWGTCLCCIGAHDCIVLVHITVLYWGT